MSSQVDDSRAAMYAELLAMLELSDVLDDWVIPVPRELPRPPRRWEHEIYDPR